MGPPITSQLDIAMPVSGKRKLGIDLVVSQIRLRTILSLPVILSAGHLALAGGLP